MTDKEDSPGTFGEVHGASEDVLGDASDTTKNPVSRQDIDELIELLIDLDPAFEPNWTDTDIDLTAAKLPDMFFTQPEAMLSQALDLNPDISKKLQAGMLAEYIRTHGNPHNWVDDKEHIQGVIGAVEEHRKPQKIPFDDVPEWLIRRPPPPLVDAQKLLDWTPHTSELDPATPLVSAMKIKDHRFTHGDHNTLVRCEDEFSAWDGSKYRVAPDNMMVAEIYKFAEYATYKRGKEERNFNPNQTKVRQVLDALKAITQLPDGNSSPCWLDETNYPPADEIVACENGLLHLPTRTIQDHTPTFFSQNALPYGFVPDTQEPAEFFKFLDSILGDDPEAEDLLQEIFGYIVSGATSLQKIFAIVGPKRAGKGVLGRLIEALIGSENACSPSLGSFATNFPLQPLIGKTLALMSDARLDARVHTKVIVEHMLRVSGEDNVNVARKNRTDWSGRLLARFMLLTNEVPRLADASGALAGRFVTLVLTKSFFGKEDPALTDRLLTELPSILNWALDGWDRLQEQGRFTVPASSREVMKELEHLSSPILAFIENKCVVGDGEEVAVDALYNAWTVSCRDDGQNRVTTKATFARDLRAALPSLKKVRKNKNSRRVHFYLGVGLIPPSSGKMSSIMRPRKGRRSKVPRS